MSMVQNNARAIIIRIVIIISPIVSYPLLRSLHGFSIAIVLAGQQYSLKDLLYTAVVVAVVFASCSLLFILRFTFVDAFEYVLSCHGWCLLLYSNILHDTKL